MILITGGRGAVATQLLSLLHERRLPVRVCSTDPARLGLPGDVPSATLNLTEPSTFHAALSGITQVFLYASAAHIKEFIAEAAEAGVKHVVLLSSASVLNRDAERDPLAASHLTVEKALLASAIHSTILRPGSFAANASAWAWPVKSGQPISLPFPDAYSDPIHEKDIAEAAYATLTDPAHVGGEFTLTGPATVTFREQIDQLATVLSRSIATKNVTREEWKREMADYMRGDYADALLNWWESNNGKPTPLTDTVQRLTGHPGRDFSSWATDHLADFQ